MIVKAARGDGKDNAGGNRGNEEGSKEGSKEGSNNGKGEDQYSGRKRRLSDSGSPDGNDKDSQKKRKSEAPDKSKCPIPLCKFSLQEIDNESHRCKVFLNHLQTAHDIKIVPTDIEKKPSGNTIKKQQFPPNAHPVALQALWSGPKNQRRRLF